MTQPLNKLAHRLEADPFFLACPLRDYAQSEGLDDAALATRLGCTMENLVNVKLCRAPRPDADSFPRDIDLIVERFGVSGEVLTEAIRRAQVLAKMRKQGNTSAFLAARDGDKTGGEA